MRRHAFAFLFSAHFFVICRFSALLGCFCSLFGECKHKPRFNIFCYFVYFNSCPIVPRTLGTAGQKNHFFKCARKLFCEFRSVKIAYDRFSCIDYTKKVWSGYKL